MRGSYFSFCLKNREVKYRGSRTFPSLPAPQLWSQLPLINPLKLTQIFKPQTQQQSIFTTIQPNPDLLPSRCCLSQLPSTQSVSTAKCVSHVCATMCVAYIRLLNAFALLSVAVLSCLFVLPPCLGNCCTAAILTPSLSLFRFYSLLSFFHHCPFTFERFIAAPVAPSHTHTYTLNHFIKVEKRSNYNLLCDYLVHPPHHAHTSVQSPDFSHMITRALTGILPDSRWRSIAFDKQKKKRL